MMMCSQIQKKLSLLLSGQLAPDQIKALEVHLSQCPKCRHTKEQFEATHHALVDFVNSLDEAIEHVRQRMEHQISNLSPETQALRISRRFDLYMKVAAVLLIGLSVTVGIQSIRKAIVNNQSDHRKQMAEAALAKVEFLYAAHDVQGLIDLFSVDSQPVKLAVIRRLGDIGNSEAVIALQRLAQNTQGELKDAAKQALESLPQDPTLEAPVEQTQEPLPQNPALEDPVDSMESINEPATIPNSMPVPEPGHTGSHRQDVDNQHAGMLSLMVIDKQTCRPIEGAGVYGRISQKMFDLDTNRYGCCDIDIGLEALTDMRIIISKHGYVSKLLQWWRPPESGIALPLHYLLQLERAFTIGGWVRTMTGEPVADVAVRVETAADPRSMEHNYYIKSETRTDENGCWQLHDFPAEVAMLYIELKHETYVNIERYSGALSSLQLQSLFDQTCVLLVEIWGGGRTVSGRFIFPDTLSRIDSPWNRFLLKPVPVIEPSSISRIVIPEAYFMWSPEQRMAWWHADSRPSPGVTTFPEQAAGQFPFIYPLRVADNGCFQTEDVPAGDYQLHALIYDPPIDEWDQQRRLLAEVIHPITVPEIQTEHDYDTPVDLGDILFPEELFPIVINGQTAPDITMTDLNGRTVQLEELRGRFVLLDLGSVSRDSEYRQKTLPALKQLQREIDANIPFEILSVNIMPSWDPDAVIRALRYFSEQQQITWTLGITDGGLSDPVFRAAYEAAGHVPSLMLIGPDGEVLAPHIEIDQLSRLIPQALGQSN